MYRFRVGGYRVIYRVTRGQIVVIERVRTRAQAYRGFPDLSLVEQAANLPSCLFVRESFGRNTSLPHPANFAHAGGVLCRLCPCGNAKAVLVQRETEKRRSPLVSIPPFGRGFSRHEGLSIRCGFGGARKSDCRAPDHRLDEPTKLSLGMVASLQSPLPFCLATSL